MIKSEKIYSPQGYLDVITGLCFCNSGDNDVEMIEKILESKGYELWSYPFTEIDHIVNEQLNVVLVDCLVYSEKKEMYEHVYRWFQVPDDFVDED